MSEHGQEPSHDCGRVFTLIEGFIKVIQLEIVNKTRSDDFLDDLGQNVKNGN